MKRRAALSRRISLALARGRCMTEPYAEPIMTPVRPGFARLAQPRGMHGVELHLRHFAQSFLGLV